MKSYRQIDTYQHWNDLIPKIEPKVYSLLVKDNKNFTLAWGVEDEFLVDTNFDFKQFESFREKTKRDYSFGFLSYDIKNSVEEKLDSNNEDHVGFPTAYFFLPQHIIFVKNGRLIYFGNLDAKNLLELISSDKELNPHPENKLTLLELTTKAEYLKKIQAVKDKIQRGDIYEMNYCIAFKANVDKFDSLQRFNMLQKETEAPFSAYLNLEFGSILSASPERFLRKKNFTLLSQPIKGTAPRSKTPSIDLELKNELMQDPKETSENIMIVDLVRNDLSKLATKNSVSVERLCDVHSFKTVHQLVSSITCELKEEVSDSKIIQSLFPMRSMTGAPKVSAMQIAEELENFKRGVYSGAIGFFQPNQNFDFNVVIRSIIFNNKTGVVSASVGGAITNQSDPQKEYEECLTKLEALQKSLC